MNNNEILLAIAGLIGFFGSLFMIYNVPEIHMVFPGLTNLVHFLLSMMTEIILIISVIVLIRVFVFWVRDCLLKYSKS